MSEIERYDEEFFAGQYEGIRPYADGDYVLYDEHLTALAAKDARIAELEVLASVAGDAIIRRESELAVIASGEHPFAARLREGGPQIAAEVDRMMGDAATPSEDGREVPEVVGTVTASGMRRGVNSVVSRPALHGLRPGDALMTVAQHSRIVAAKDAEIARLTVELQEAEGESEEWRKAFIAEGGGL